MPANMSRLRQVGGMSTRQSLNRPRLGVTNAFQGMAVQELRLNGKNLGMGFEGPATTLYTRSSKGRYGQEKIFGKDCNVKHLLHQCLKADPDWKPSRYARKEWREHDMLNGQQTAEGLLK